MAYFDSSMKGETLRAKRCVQFRIKRSKGESSPCLGMTLPLSDNTRLFSEQFSSQAAMVDERASRGILPVGH